MLFLLLTFCIVCFLHYHLQSCAFALMDMYKHKCCLLCGQSTMKAFAKLQRKIGGLGTPVHEKPLVFRLSAY